MRGTALVYSLCIGEPGQPASFADRMTLLQAVVSLLRPASDPFLLLLPGGFAMTEVPPPSEEAAEITAQIQAQLTGCREGSLICFGLDGAGGLDQQLLCVSNGAVVAHAQKFYKAPGEPRDTVRTSDPFAGFNGRPRIVEFGDRRLYLSVCYDCFGIRKTGAKNPGVDGILDVAHWFSHSGASKGASYYARLGLAGAANAWDVQVIASGAFEDAVQEAWPAGVRAGAPFGKTSTYDDLRLEPRSSRSVDAAGLRGRLYEFEV